MPKRKLTKGQIEGIRLIADAFVVREINGNVFQKDEKLNQHFGGYINHMKKNSPILFVAEDELQKQIKEVRKIFLEELEKDLTEPPHKI